MYVCVSVSVLYLRRLEKDYQLRRERQAMENMELLVQPAAIPVSMTCLTCFNDLPCFHSPAF